MGKHLDGLAPEPCTGCIFCYLHQLFDPLRAEDGFFTLWNLGEQAQSCNRVALRLARCLQEFHKRRDAPCIHDQHFELRTLR